MRYWLCKANTTRMIMCHSSRKNFDYLSNNNEERHSVSVGSTSSCKFWIYRAWGEKFQVEEGREGLAWHRFVYWIWVLLCSPLRYYGNGEKTIHSKTGSCAMDGLGKTRIWSIQVVMDDERPLRATLQGFAEGWNSFLEGSSSGCHGWWMAHENSRSAAELDQESL